MSTAFKTIEQLGIASRRVAAALVAGIWRRRTLSEVEEGLTSLPRVEQRLVVGGVLSAAFLISLLAAQLGWIAMLAFWLAVVIIVN